MNEYRFKLCIFGDGGVGKTTLIQRYLEGMFKATFRQTVGMDFYLKKLELGGKKISLQVWDFGGEEKFRFLLPGAVSGANGCIFLYDITRYLTFKNLDNWISVFNESNRELGQTVSTILVGSKLDLAETRAVAEVDAINFSKANGFNYIECSSKSGENVEDVFTKIGELMMKNATYLKDL
ncbi:MAG: GTP-binding protein [Candidatus Lokiarchaeota archaeon]|nr:GTP-binding protein [Candidatus Lokiarchaeota archaeon]